MLVTTNYIQIMLFTIWALYLFFPDDGSVKSITYTEVTGVSDRRILWKTSIRSLIQCSYLCEVDTCCNIIFYNPNEAGGSNCEGSQVDASNTSPAAGTNFYARESESCMSNCTEYQGKCYGVFDISVRWDDAWQKCKDVNADLLIINSTDVQTFIVNLLTDGNYQQSRFWLGHTYSSTAAAWQWADRHGNYWPISFSYWYTGEPNYLGLENCAYTYLPADGIWQNNRCYSTVGFVCQTDID